MHDEAREQDLVDMVEALLQLSAEFLGAAKPRRPAIHRPEAHFGPGCTGELEWCSVCAARGAGREHRRIVSAGYPDVRLGSSCLAAAGDRRHP